MSKRNKVRSAEEAVAAIPSGATIAIGGTGAVLEADALLDALERRFLAEKEPRDLTLVFPMGPGDRPGQGGLNSLAHSGMTRRVIGPSFSRQRHPRLLEMIESEECESYVVGMGTLVQLMTAIGAAKPGVFTTVGLGTFLDPRQGGGAMNSRSTNLPVQVHCIGGQEYLFYPSFPIDVAVIRATTADENGYLSFEEEPNTLAMLEIAMATKARGGMVLAQVKRLAREHSLDPRMVRVPGALVDTVVVNPRQTPLSPAALDPASNWFPFLNGDLKAPLTDIPPLEGGPRSLIVRRAALELNEGDIVNLGIGVATDLPRLALQEGILDDVVFTNEHGVFGGLMANAIANTFVPAINPDAIMDSAFQFNFYDGGGLDVTFLSFGEVDGAGNVNVSKFGGRLNGLGGFANIADSTKRVVFCGTMTAGGLEVESDGRTLRVVQEGRIGKFVPQVEQVTFNAARAFEKGQLITYVTERAVFRLTAAGPELVEIAPGISVDDVRSIVGFPLMVSDSLKTMDIRVLGNGSLGLKKAFEERNG